MTAHGGVRVRKARPEEAGAIARLNNDFAGAGLMLRRSEDAVALAIDDYLVAVDARGRLLACGALKEYSPSLAEVSAIAVSPDAQGLGLGRAVVRAVERLALKRGIHEVFALTLQPRFFEAVGYSQVARARYPEKIRRDCLSCARLLACDELCYMRDLAVEPAQEVRTAA